MLENSRQLSNHKAIISLNHPVGFGMISSSGIQIDLVLLTPSFENAT